MVGVTGSRPTGEESVFADSSQSWIGNRSVRSSTGEDSVFADSSPSWIGTCSVSSPPVALVWISATRGGSWTECPVVKLVVDPPRYVEANEYSGWRSGMTVSNEAWSELMTYRPVWVRSRPIFCFPVGILRCVAVVHPTGHSTRPVGMVGMSLAWGSELACVPTDHS